MLKLLMKNLFDDATLSASPTLTATLPEGNLKIARRDAVARSTSSATQHVYCSWTASDQQINAICIWGHNLSENGTWRVKLYESTDHTGTAVYDSGTQTALPAKALDELNWGIDELGAYWQVAGGTAHAVLWLDSAYNTVQSADIEWYDSTLSYTQVQRVYMGNYFEPGVNFDYGAKLNYIDESTFSRSSVGSLFVERASRYRTLELSLSWLTNSEVLELGELLMNCGKNKDLLVSAQDETTNLGRRLQYTMAARFAELPTIVGVCFDVNSTILKLTEI